jgi:hypothetical protein
VAFSTFTPDRDRSLRGLTSAAMTDPAPRSSAAQAIHLDELDRIPVEHGV